MMVLRVYRVDCYLHSVCSGFLRTFINAWRISPRFFLYYVNNINFMFNNKIQCYGS